MATSINLGYPEYVDGATYPLAGLRQIDAMVAFTAGGTAASVAPLGGVLPHATANLAVTAPASGLSVNVAAGYVVVPDTSTGQGAWYFGLMQSGALTVPANATGSNRVDYVLAVAGTAAAIEYVTGTASPPALPPSSLILARLTVPNGTANITTAMITDLRTWAVARNGVLPIATAAAAPAGHASQILYNLANNQLYTSTATVGAPKLMTLLPQISEYVYTPAGTTLYQTEPAPLVTISQVTVTCDGMTDLEITASVFAFEALPYIPIATAMIWIDGTVVDSVNSVCSQYGSSTTYPSLSWTFFTSSVSGTTPSAGKHVISSQFSALYDYGGIFGNRYYAYEGIVAVSPFSLRVASVVT
jgi:hypothetical protein